MFNEHCSFYVSNRYLLIHRHMFIYNVLHIFIYSTCITGIYLITYQLIGYHLSNNY